MGSHFFDLHLANPEAIATRVRGDDPNLVQTLRQRPEPPDERLIPAFEVMAKGLLCFLPKGADHPEGIVYCRAVEYLLNAYGERRWGIEFYPDEDEWAIWTLVFDRCEAEWLTLPFADSEVATIRWRSARTCQSASWSLQTRLREQSFNPRYISAASLEEMIAALDEGSRTGYGLFVIYQA